MGIAVSVDGQPRMQVLDGGLRADEPVPVMSVTKWMVAAVVLRLVDRGLLRLDDPCGRYLPSFRVQHGQITLRQLLCHTSGLPSVHPALFLQGLTLGQAVDALGATPLLTLPGAEFRYGHCSYQVAGHIASLVTGKPFARLFHDELVAPLGLRSTDLEAFGRTENPILAMCARSSLDDCLHFVEALAGRVGDRSRPYLSPRMQAEMFRDQVGRLPRAAHPFADGRPYGLGVFLERTDGRGRALRAAHPGAFGFWPWVDFDRRLCGVLAIQGSLPQVGPWVVAMQDWLEHEVWPDGVTQVGHSTPGCDGVLRLWVPGSPRAGVPGYGLRCEQAPPGGLGLLLLGASARNPGLNLFGSRVLVSPGPGLLQLVVVADPAGTHAMPLPLEHFAPRQGFALQYVWLEPRDCPARTPVPMSPAIATSPALALELR
ncbi:MAG: serine hydrolase domain-containing protein [Planctomycetota bacterium]